MILFWKTIESLNWDGDYKRCEKELVKNYSKEDLEKIENVFDNLMSDLHARFEQDWLNYIEVSDDGWSDLRAEVIGRGQEFFHSITVEKLVEMAENGDYTESFAYVFPYDYKATQAEIEAENKPTQIEASEKVILDKVKTIIMTTKGHIDREHTVAAIQAAVKLEFKKLK